MLKIHQVSRRDVSINNEVDEAVEAMVKNIFIEITDEKSGKPLIKCTECNKTFHFRHKKKGHIKKYHLNEVHMCTFSIDCGTRLCGEIFKSGITLTQHILDCHNTDGLGFDVFDDDNITWQHESSILENGNETQSYENEDGIGTTNKSHVENRSTDENKHIVEDMNDTNVKSVADERHSLISNCLEIEKQKPFEKEILRLNSESCDVKSDKTSTVRSNFCGKIVRDLLQEKNEKETQTAEEKNESSIENFSQHYKVIEDEESKLIMYGCLYCDYKEKFLKLQSLSQHIKKKHRIPLGNFVCDVCGSVFRNSIQLQSHLRYLSK